MDTSIIRKLTDLNEMARHSRIGSYKVISLEPKTVINSSQNSPKWKLF